MKTLTKQQARSILEALNIEEDNILRDPDALDELYMDHYILADAVETLIAIAQTVE